MNPYRLVVLLVLTVVLSLAVTPGLSATELVQAQEPVVTVDTETEKADDTAWTFRYLVPTAIVASAIAVVLVGVLYGVRVRGRYRVKR